MSQNETLTNIVAGITTAVKKFPLAAAGAPVDLANIVAGGFANIVDVARGKQVTREIADGLVPKPVGGSEWLYEKFGFNPKSSGLAEDSASAALSPLSPGGALKAMFVPAVGFISSSSVRAAEKMLSKKGHMDLDFQKRTFQNLGVVVPHADKVPRTIISDNTATLNPNRLSQTSAGIKVSDGPLEDLLIHPQLFDNPVIKASGLGKIKIGTDSSLNKSTRGAYYPGLDEMGLNYRLNTEEDIISVILHETQHGVQKRFGMSGGDSVLRHNPDYFKLEALKVDFWNKQRYYGDVLNKAGIPTPEIADFLKGNPTPRSREISKKFFGMDYGDYVLSRQEAQAADVATKEAYSKYIHNLGEAEARATQKMRASRLAPTTFPYLEPVFDVDYRLTTSGKSGVSSSVSFALDAPTARQFMNIKDVPRMAIGPSVVTPNPISPGSQLYSEMDGSRLNDILRSDRQTDFRPMWVSDNPDLALGQGSNKGVKVTFRPDSLSGVESRAKPGLQAGLAGKEYQTDIIAPQAIQSFIVDKKFNPKHLDSLARRTLATEFTVTDTPDGKKLYIRKP